VGRRDGGGQVARWGGGGNMVVSQGGRDRSEGTLGRKPHGGSGARRCRDRRLGKCTRKKVGGATREKTEKRSNDNGVR
jgi:hypothetical protein